MTQTAINYAKALYGLHVSASDVEEAARICAQAPELGEVLDSSVVARVQKERIIDRVFPEGVRNFFKVLLAHRDTAYAGQIFEAYHAYACEQEGVLQAVLYCVTEPEEEQLEKIKEGLRRRHGKKEVELRLVRDPGLIGGFILRTGDLETDWSMRGRLKQLEQTLIKR